MRIKAVQLSWFRGASERASLEPDCKSMVVYGVNGSGKSSFVDAIEYVLNDGKIGHLAHEYSGKRQEKAIPNTHKPHGQKIRLSIKFSDDSELITEIADDGSSTFSGAEAVAMQTWDYRRTVLRQNELGAFIHDTKGDKYSALLPLLGLHQLEVAAENLRRLVKSVNEKSRLWETVGLLKEVEKRRKATFGADADDQIQAKIVALHAKYSANRANENDALSCCVKLKVVLESRIAGFSADQRRYVALKGAAEVDLQGLVNAVRFESTKLATAVEPLIAEKLEVIRSASMFVMKSESGKDLNCPACGRCIAVEDFRAHLRTESALLQDLLEVFEMRKAAIGSLCETVSRLKASLANSDLMSWRDEIAKGGLADNIVFLDGIDPGSVRLACAEQDLTDFEAMLLPLIAAAAEASKDAPPDVPELMSEMQLVEVGKAVIAAIAQAASVARAQRLIEFINSLEWGIREEIRLRAEVVIGEITESIKRMWAILHPEEAIKGVRLFLPKSADKAIDIGLIFYGVQQESPRLTLSEGYRNSLGLCIFLAMASREADKDRPLFLDDVVVSLDRNHRGMIVDLLEKEFSRRQVLILTHDREWYTELRQQLDARTWTFRALLPYETPALGIRWSHKTTTFDDARAQLKTRPDSAGNDSRKIMDVELSLLAERLRIRMPYLRADKNDKRMAHDFLERLVVDGKKCFQLKPGEEYEVYSVAIKALEDADRLLISWANRGSHTFDLVRPEAMKLIETCEAALQVFNCKSCGKGVCYAEAAGSESVQCQCGRIRWRYGKG